MKTTMNHGMTIFVFTAIVCTGVYVFAVSHIVNLSEVSMATGEQGVDTMTDEYIAQILSIGRESQVERKQLASYFYREENISNVFKQFEDVARVSGTRIEVQSIQLLPEGDALPRAVLTSASETTTAKGDTVAQRKKLLSAVIVSLAVTGDDEHVQKALNYLEHMPFVSKINEVQITNDERGEGMLARVSFSVTLHKAVKK